MKKVTGVLSAATLALGLAGVASAASLNEAVMNDGGADDREYVELCGSPGESLVGLRLVVIEGEGATARGAVDQAIALTGVVGASGYYVIGDAAVSPDQAVAPGWIENGGLTILLVSGYVAPAGGDVDANNDGIADGSIGTIIDGVGTAIPSSSDVTYYGVPTLGPDTGDTGTSTFDVAGLVRCVECDGAWGMICLNGTDPNDPFYTGCDTDNTFNPYFVSDATPGTANLCPPVSVDAQTWGKTKSEYR